MCLIPGFAIGGHTGSAEVTLFLPSHRCAGK